MATVSIAPSYQPFGNAASAASRHSLRSLPLLLLPRGRRRGLCHSTSRSTPARSEMSSSSSSTAAAESPSLPPLPGSRVVVGCGGMSVDYLATVAAFPKPDDKIRSTSSMVQGGGNAGNALTGAARLGLKPRIISKIANDAQGRTALAELENDGVETSYIVVSQEGNSPFTYIIVDSQTKTRTCIHTPGFPGMVPDDLPRSSLLSALDGARLAYFDGRLPETALVVAQEEWTGAQSTASALLSILLKLPNVQFVVVTLGEKGCIMLERSVKDVPEPDEMDIDSLVASLKENADMHNPMPTCIYSKSNMMLSSKGIGSIHGRLILGTAEIIPPMELIDTTGAGDAFIGAILYAAAAHKDYRIGLAPAIRIGFKLAQDWSISKQF